MVKASEIFSSMREKLDKWDELFNYDSMFNADRERRKKAKFGWTANDFTTVEELTNKYEQTNASR